jgi:hypothetical protein
MVPPLSPLGDSGCRVIEKLEMETKMERTQSPQADADVAFAVMQEATERLVEFMRPVDAVQAIAAFGIMSMIEVAGYDVAKETMMRATAEALKAQLRAVAKSGGTD